VNDIVQAGTRALEAYISAGDIGRLGPDQRVALYRAVCDSLGLNPLTQPFQYLVLSGKTVLYATKSATEQLRQIHGVSVVSMVKEVVGDILTVTVSVRDKTGREDISTGSVSLANLKGESLANAWMKCETKAKRRATLSICGLAILDETEVDSIAGAVPVDLSVVHASPALPAAETAEKPARKKKVESTVVDPAPEVAAPVVEETSSEVEIYPNAKVSVVTNGSGKTIWRVDQEPLAPIAIVDPNLATSLEANQAFGLISRCRLERRSGKSILVSISEEVVRV
jgi:hypothetical protein